MVPIPAAIMSSPRQKTLQAIGQTPIRNKDKRRLAVRIEADTKGRRAGLPCKEYLNACTCRLKNQENRRRRCKRYRSIAGIMARIPKFPLELSLRSEKQNGEATTSTCCGWRGDGSRRMQRAPSISSSAWVI